MINLPYNAASMSQITPCQNVPVQTSQYNFPTRQQQQTSTQQMQTAACGPCSGVSRGPFAQVHQPETYIITHQCTPGGQQATNPCHPAFQGSCNPLLTSRPSCAQLPQNILDQIRACVSNAAPIFILPGSYQQSPAPQQQQQQPLSVAAPPQTMTSSYAPSGLTYPAACYPPQFYPYPVPLPYCDPFIRARESAQSCGCCRGRDVDQLPQSRSVARAGCRYDVELDEHRCTPTTDDTICSKRNCPSSLHLQALASQFLSMQGIIACAATRLVLRKVPGSNVTTTMEDTMARAQRAINALAKDQLLSESRNAQQVNALINLHMTANPPPNIIPILTLVQLKMNLLKAQVEGLVNQRLMETQGVGVEVETDLIDPTVLALKSDAELRDFLSALRQKECDERVNVNFAPYRSQRAIAETRLSNVQNKIRQVEAELDRRRCAMLPAPTLSSRIVQQFSVPCYSARFEDPRRLYSSLPTADAFAAKPRSPKRLLLKPCMDKPEAAAAPAADAVPQKTGDGAGRVQERSTTTDDQRTGAENCTCCDRATSEENVDEAKKKLRSRIVEIGATVNDIDVGPRESALAELTSDVCVTIGTRKCQASARKRDESVPCRGSGARIFPPLKDLRRYVTSDEKNGDAVGTCPRPITKAGIADTKRLSRSNDATKDTLGTRNGDNRLHPSNVECEESFISEIFSIISKHVVAFVNKILALNKELLYSSRNEILHKSLNIDISRKAIPICDQSGSILKDHDPFANTSHYPVETSQETSKNAKDFCDASLLRVSNWEGHGNIHQIRYLIVRNKENGTKYLWISTSKKYVY